MSRFAQVLWHRMPAAVAQVWLTLGMAIGDGARLRRWSAVAVGVPIGGFVLGLILGAGHAGPVYTYSLAVVLLLLATTAFGAGVGWWTWIGFMIADLADADRSSLPGFGYGVGGTDRLLQGYVPLFLTYVLLAFLLVLTPLVALGFSARVAARLGSSSPSALVGYAVYVLVVAATSYAWSHAIPFMVRPLWSFAGEVPDISGIQPVQGNAAGVALVGGLAALGRCVWTVLAAGRLDPLVMPVLSLTRRRISSSASVAFVPVQALIITLLLGGLLERAWTAALVWLLVSVVLAARVVVVPRLPIWPQLILRVPLLLRVGICAAAAYVLSTIFVQPQVDEGESSFASLVFVLLATLTLSALLLPRASAGIPAGGPGSAGTGPVGQHPLRPLSGPLPTRRPNSGAGAGPVQFAWAGWIPRVAIGFAIVTGQTLVIARPAAADNCSGLSDCSFGVKIALVIAAIALIAILIVLLPEILGAGAAGAAVGEGTVAAGAGVAAEAAAAAALSGAEAAVVAEAAAGAAVSAEATIAAGTVGAGGKLAAVLTAVESAWAASAPTSAVGALQAVATGTASVGLEPGIAAGVTAGGTIVLSNVGNVTTYIFNTGQVLIMRGSEVLLNLFR